MSTLAYYRSLEGAYRGTFSFRIAHWSRLGSLPLHRALELVAMALFFTLPGAARMSTTLGAVEGAPRATFRHTTEVRKWGLLLYETEELIVLGDDGRSLTMTGTQRMRPGAATRYEAIGDVDEDSRRATYRIPWLGLSLVQKTEVLPAGLRLSQSTECTEAHVDLVRQTSSAF